MLNKQITLINELGLHARAAALFVQTAGAFEAEINVSLDEKKVNGKSIMGLMMLAAAKGMEIQLNISGNDEQDAMQTLVSLIENRFGEDK
ncbi:MAG: HPr family phosphocarrier protein [Gammaproteobacteria bacterium]